MGIRINKAMGYGMPIAQFNDHFNPVTSDNHHEKMEWLYDTLVDNQETQELLSGPHDPKIIKELMDLGYRPLQFFFKPFDRINSAEPHSFAKLYYEICLENPTHVLFMPTIDFAHKWMRHDDDIDYVEFNLQNNDGPENKIVECNYGFYPYANEVRSTETDRPIDWDGTMMSRDGKRPDHIVPDVPPDLRYWLRKLDIMDNSGINQLRPIVATWWE